MVMTSINWSSTSEDESVRRVFSALDRALDSASLAFWMQAEAQPHVDERARKRFESEGDDVSGRWAALAPYTIEDRLRQQFPEGPILHRTGELEDYIVNNPGSMQIDPSGVTFETPNPTGDPVLNAKMNTAQYGYPPRNIPQRAIVGMNQSDAETLLNSLTNTIQAALEGGLI